MLLDEPDEDSVEGLIRKLALVAMRAQYRGKAADVRRLARKLEEMWQRQVEIVSPSDARPS